MCFKSTLDSDEIALTDITVYVELDINIVGPYDGINGPRKVLKEEPKAQRRDTKIPMLSHKARQKYEKQHDRGYNASDRVERVRRVERVHGVYAATLHLLPAGL